MTIGAMTANATLSTSRSTAATVTTAEIDRPVNHLARGFQIGALAEIVAAETDGGNAQARAAEIANLHGPFLWG